MYKLLILLGFATLIGCGGGSGSNSPVEEKETCTLATEGEVFKREYSQEYGQALDTATKAFMRNLGNHFSHHAEKELYNNFLFSHFNVNAVSSETVTFFIDALNVPTFTHDGTQENGVPLEDKDEIATLYRHLIKGNRLTKELRFLLMAKVYAVMYSANVPEGTLKKVEKAIEKEILMNFIRADDLIAEVEGRANDLRSLDSGLCQRFKEYNE